MIRWAEALLSHPQKEPFFMAAGIYRPICPCMHPRLISKGHPTESIALPALKADDLEDVPPAGKAIFAHRADDFKLVVESGR